MKVNGLWWVALLIVVFVGRTAHADPPEAKASPLPSGDLKAEEEARKPADSPKLFIVEKDGKRYAQIRQGGKVIESKEIGPATSKAQPLKSSKFIRVRRSAKDTKKIVALQTNSVRYKNDSGITIDLIGAVHVGDRNYYEGLNRQFEKYDTLFYELVAPKGTKIPEGGLKRSEGPLAILQQTMTLFLGLSHQLDVINYNAKNFVHADLSPKMLKAEMAKSGDTAMTMFLDVMATAMRNQNLKANPAAGGGLSLETLALDPHSVKLLMAKHFDQMEDPTTAFGGAFGNLVISARNKHAIEIIKQHLKTDGDKKGKLAYGVFYGAGHMPDFEKQLAGMGFKKAEESWRDAWDLQNETRDSVGDLLKALKLLEQAAQGLQ